MADALIIDRFERWMNEGLGCIAGRRELQTGRYMTRVVRKPGDALKAYESFLVALGARRAVACLFILDLGSDETTNAAADMMRMAELMAELSDRPAVELANGSALGKSIEAPCPVTNELVDFNDFDVVAFSPHSEDVNDPLYDPMMSAPIPCANLNSDVYAFSMFVRDSALARYGCEVWELSDSVNRRKLFEHAARLWQRFAVKTIRNYVNITDVARCPTFLTPDHRHWYANHQDPAFAETRKELYRHDMPIIYTQKLIEAWTRFYEDGIPVRVSGITEPGHLEPTTHRPAATSRRPGRGRA